jgi:hypothetical protein
MRLTSLLAVATLVLLAGCRPKTEAAMRSENDARRACQSTVLTLTPWNTETALVEESEYTHLVKQVADQISLSLRDRVDKMKKFDRVIDGASCTSGARVENRVVSLIHKRRKYHFRIAGRVVECGTERLLHTYELEQVEKGVENLAGELADDIAGKIDDDGICTALAAAQANPGAEVQASPEAPPADALPPPPPPPQP